MADALLHHAAMTFSNKEPDRVLGEKFLLGCSVEPGFAPLALQIAANEEVPMELRQAIVLRLKNFIKEAWFDRDNAADPKHKIQREDREIIKGSVVSAMVVCPPLIRVQLAVVVEAIAKHDFPQEYPSLLTDLIQNFSSGQYDRIMAVLECADLIFRRYRTEAKTERLWTEISIVLEAFAVPLLQLFQHLVELLSGHLDNQQSLSFLLDNLQLIGNIHLSLCSQDIPEVFEDALKEWMPRFMKLLELENKILPAKNQTAGPLEKLQSVICEIVSLYSSKYEEEFEDFIQGFVNAVWQLVTRLNESPEYDQVIVNAISLLTTIASKARYQGIFSSEEALNSLIERVVIPNLRLRQTDLEAFEFNGLDYVRSDWEGSNQFTRRRVASDLVRALCGKFEKPLSEIVLHFVQRLLTEYSKDRIHNWIAKDTAMSLVLAVSVQGSTERFGATRINENVNILEFFAAHVLPELESPNIDENPMLKATSLRFISTFRTHLPREAFGVLMPLLLKFLQNDVFVVHTYAAITIEKLVDLRDLQTNTAKFSPEDLKPFLESILTGLFAVFSHDESSENDYVMLSIMKVCQAAGAAVTPHVKALLDQLSSILIKVSRNPKNPVFNHNIFEVVAVLIGNVCASSPQAVRDFESILFPSLQSMLSTESTLLEFGPCVFQIFSQLLAFNETVSAAYIELFPYLLQPAFWEHTGNSLGLVQLMSVYLAKPGFAGNVVQGDLLKRLLGVFQKLLSSMNTDSMAMDLLRSIVDYVPWNVLSSLASQIWAVLFTRAKNSLTDSFSQDLSSFIGYFAFTHGVETLVSTIESVQRGMFGMVLQKLVLAKIENVLSPVARRNVALGLTKIVFDSNVLFNDAHSGMIVPCVATILDLVERDDTSSVKVGQDEEALLKMQEGGFSNVFSKLRASNVKIESKLKDVDVKQVLHQAVCATGAQRPDVLATITQSLPPNFQGIFRLYTA
eukprot:TRINITY_DN24152_c0_g1_i1.p1 TRINITY_DN24152_c0_g1~~TRINITY_DN24152_c0_g1_i1.p1  ORF type:complete len:984 (-),score=244.54 TRINITY_DN24152_c0_g1_i1:24-2912(-)